MEGGDTKCMGASRGHLEEARGRWQGHGIERTGRNSGKTRAVKWKERDRDVDSKMGELEDEVGSV